MTVAVAETVPSADDLVARAAAMYETLQSRAKTTEDSRRVSSETVREMVDAGLFRTLQPKRFGGYEHDLQTYLRIVDRIGRACGSSAWVFSVLAMHQWQVGMFPVQAQEDIWGENPNALTASSFAPSGTARRVADGFELSGTWSFASGCDNADWFVLGARVLSEDSDDVALVFFLVPIADVHIDDNWHVLGLAGTGSKNIVIDQAVFVPEHRQLSFADALTHSPPGTETNDGALYRIPFFAAVATCLCGPAVGVAQGALDDFIEQVSVRETRGVAIGGAKKMAEFPTLQMKVAEASALIDAARLLLMRDVDDTLSTVGNQGELTREQRLRNRRDHAYSVRMCVKAVDLLFEAVGGQGLFNSHKVQRAWRDIHAIEKHIALSWDATGTLYGSVALGIEPQGGQF